MLGQIFKEFKAILYTFAVTLPDISLVVRDVISSTMKLLLNIVF